MLPFYRIQKRLIHYDRLLITSKGLFSKTIDWQQESMSCCIFPVKVPFVWKLSVFASYALWDTSAIKGCEWIMGIMMDIAIGLNFKKPKSNSRRNLPLWAADSWPQVSPQGHSSHRCCEQSTSASLDHLNNLKNLILNQRVLWMLLSPVFQGE